MVVTGRGWIVVALLATAAAGCGRLRARTPAPTVALATPDPPAHLVIPVELTEPDVVQPSAPVTLTPAPPVKRRETPVAARPADPAPASPAPPADAEAAPAAPVLQMTPNTGAAEQRIYTLLATAQRNLENVSYHALSPSARQQYDQAKGFIRMAHDALKIKNYSYAEKLASKAEAVAGLLPKS